MTDPAAPQTKPVQDEPPNYRTIAPYAPPDSYPPTAPPTDGGQLKGVPPGLEYLTQVNFLSVKEKFKVSQGWGRSFEILDSSGQRVFLADEAVHFCGPLYDVKILDNAGNGVMDLIENCACTCTKEMRVQDVAGDVLAFVTLHWNNAVTHLSVKNSAQEVVLMIIGPGFRTNIYGNVSFEVKSRDEQHVVGMIKNESEQFVVSFPLDLEVTVKAALLGSCLYLDSLVYRKRRQLERRSRDARH